MKNINILICFLFTVVFSNKIYCQEEGSAYKSKLLFRASYGLNVSHTSMNQNRETDYLIDYNDKIYTTPSIAALFFIRKHWGAEITIKMPSPKNNDRNQENFRNFANNKYGENYFVNSKVSSYGVYDPAITFGIVYRLETDKMYIYPKLAFGSTPVDFSSGEIQLKEKNSNAGYRDYYSDEVYENFFTVSPSVSAGYKLTKRFWIDISINTSYFRPKFSFDKTLTNLYSKEVQTENIAYKKNMFDTYISLGIIYVAVKKK